MFLIDDILLAPVNGFKFILNQIQKMADQELNDDTFTRLRAIKERQLGLLHQAHTAKSSSFEIETGGDEESQFWEPGER
jgi:hypothetical protein